MGGIRSIQRPRMTRRDDSLIGQVVAANVVLVALTLFAASLAAGLDLTVREPDQADRVDRPVGADHAGPRPWRGLAPPRTERPGRRYQPPVRLVHSAARPHRGRT